MFCHVAEWLNEMWRNQVSLMRGTDFKELSCVTLMFQFQKYGVSGKRCACDVTYVRKSESFAGPSSLRHTVTCRPVTGLDVEVMKFVK